MSCDCDDTIIQTPTDRDVIIERSHNLEFYCDVRIQTSLDRDVLTSSSHLFYNLRVASKIIEMRS